MILSAAMSGSPLPFGCGVSGLIYQVLWVRRGLPRAEFGLEPNSARPTFAGVNFVWRSVDVGPCAHKR